MINKDELFQNIYLWKKAYNQWSADPKDKDKRQHPLEMRKDLKKTVKACKMTWLNNIAKHVADAHMLNMNGWDTWKAIEEIVAGVIWHH